MHHLEEEVRPQCLEDDYFIFQTFNGLRVRAKYLPYFFSSFAKYVERYYPLNRHVLRTLDICNRDFTFDTLDVSYYFEDLAKNRKETGQMPCGGSSDDVSIDLDFYSVTLEDIAQIRVFLPALIAHEFGHLARRRLTGRGDNNTIFESAVDEGIAIEYQKRIFPKLVTFEPQAKNYPLGEFKQEFLLDMDKALTNSIIDKWFFGNGKLPPCAIYPLARQLTLPYFEKHALSSKQLVTVNPEEIREFMKTEYL